MHIWGAHICKSHASKRAANHCCTPAHSPRRNLFGFIFHEPLSLMFKWRGVCVRAWVCECVRTASGLSCNGGKSIQVKMSYLSICISLSVLVLLSLCLPSTTPSKLQMWRTKDPAGFFFHCSRQSGTHLNVSRLKLLRVHKTKKWRPRGPAASLSGRSNLTAFYQNPHSL